MKTRMDRQRVTNILLFIVVIFIIGVVLKLVQHVITALLISLLLAYLMDTFVVFMRRIRLPRVFAYGLTICIFLGAFMGLGYLLFTNLREFQVDFPLYEDRILDIFQKTQVQLSSALSMNVPFNPIGELKNLPIASIVLKTAQSVFGITFDFVIVFFFSVLILLGKHQFIRKLLKTFPRSRASRVPITLSHIDRNLRRYLAVKGFVSFLAGTLETAILLLFHVKFAVIWGLLTVMLNFIPTVGALIATILPTLFSLAQFNDPFISLWVFVCISMVHMTIGNFLEPMLQGETLNLSLLVVFVSLFFWGWLWGPLGILLAVPMTATIKIILQAIPATATFATFLEKSPSRSRARNGPHPPKRPGGSDGEEGKGDEDGDRDRGPIVDKPVSQSL